MNDLIFDFAGMVYTYGVFISFITFGLFFWWLLKVKSASDVYIYVMLLILGNGISDAFSVIARALKVYVGMDPWCSFVDSTLWSFRRVPELAILTIIFARMAIRLKRTLKGIDNGGVIINNKHKDGQTNEEIQEMIDDNK